MKTFLYSGTIPTEKTTQDNTSELTCSIQVIHPLIRLWPVLSLLCAVGLGLLGALTRIEILIIIFSICGLIAPPIIIFNLFPTKDRATLKNDGMYFERNGEILFTNLVFYQTDYLMTIKVKGEKFSRTLGGQAFSNLIEGDISFEEWRNAFDQRITQWALNKIKFDPNNLANDTKEPSLPTRSYFLGSITARLMGATLIVLSCGLFFLFYLTGFNPQLLSPGLVSLFAGCLLSIKWH